jgi:hypothetical protein
MIVKVQLSLFPPDASRVLIYSQDRSVTLDATSTPKLRELMGGRPKAFFHAKVNELAQIELGAEAPWQAW